MGEGASSDSRQAARSTRRKRTLLVTGAAVLLVAVLALGAAAILSQSAAPPVEPLEETTSTVGASGEPTESVEPTSPPASEEPTPPAPVIDAFDADLTRAHTQALAGDIGVRAAGTDGERQGAAYIAQELEKLGFTPAIVKVPLPGGKTSQNVVAELPGTGERRVILGAHYDSKSPSPGANDNGTGSAALLAIAAEIKDEPLPPTIVFVWFGAEEMIDKNPDHHHYGSRAYAKAMTAEEKATTAAMLSVDMIGYGPEFRVRTMGAGPQTLRIDLLAFAKAKGYTATYLRDAGKYGWSDHEPFELAGMPAAWIEWRDDPAYHSAKDTPAHIDWVKVRQAGQLTLDYVRALDERRMDALLAQ